MDDWPSSLESSRSLQKSLSGLQYFTLGFGFIIGVGWLVVLGDWIGSAGPLGAMLAFVIGGVAILLVASCYAELAMHLPAAGGDIVYAHELFGPGLAFFVGWFLLLSNIGVITFLGLSAAILLIELFPRLDGPVLYSILGQTVRLGEVVISLGLIILFGTLNWRGVREVAWTQTAMTGVMILIIGGTVLVGLLLGDPANLDPLFAADARGSTLSPLLALLVTTPFWFAGFEVIPQSVEERSSRTSLRTVGLALVLSVLAAVFVYCLMILAVAMALPREKLGGLVLPAATAVEVLTGRDWSGEIVVAGAFLGILTSINGCIVFITRIALAMGRSRLLPALFARLHPDHHTPGPAIWTATLFASTGCLFGKDIIGLVINVGAITLALAFLVVALGVWRMRRARRDHHRFVPFGRPGIAAAIGVCMLLVSYALVEPLTRPEPSFGEFALLLGWALIGATVWTAQRRQRNALSLQQRRALLLGDHTR